MPEPTELSTPRVVTTYGVTSVLLAAAWFARGDYGLWLVNAIGACAGIMLALFTLGSRWRSVLGWSKSNAAMGITMGLALVMLTQLSARSLLPLMPPVLEETRRLYGLLEGPIGAPNFAPLIALVVIAEELVYRGVVTTYCARRFQPRAAVAWATALYVIPLAASGSWLLVVIGVTLGALWTIMRLWSKSLVVTLLAHWMWSCATFVMFPVV